MALIEREVDPISRIEGHLGVKLTVNDVTGLVEEADVHGNLWRGFENFLIGREPNDAITFTQRICGVCPLPHATASTFAVESVMGYSTGYITFAQDASGDGLGVPKKAVHIRNLVYAAEFLMSHITHFYHLAAPSYVQGPAMPPWTPYFEDGYYHPYLRSGGKVAPGLGGDPLWDVVITQYVKALRIRRLTFEAGALFAGRMPMTSSFVAGGVTVQGDLDLSSRIAKFRALMEEVGDFIVKEYVPLALALGALYPAWDNVANASLAYSVGLDFGLAADPAVDPTVAGLGAGCGNFIGWGAFPNPDTNALTLKGGYVIGGGAPITFCTGKSDVAGAIAAIKANLIEDTAFSRYAATAEAGYGTDSYLYPGDTKLTVPKRDDASKYSWLKAPRWKHSDGKYYACEVGPFARLVVNGLYTVTETDTLASTVGAGYLAYTKGAGLDPAMIETGLANALVAKGLATVADGEIGGLINAWVRNIVGGLSTMDRLRGRALEALVLVQAILGTYDKATGWPANGGWLGQLDGEADTAGSTYRSKAVPLTVKSGFGVSEAPRGALAHFVTINKGKIDSYQCVVPTTWNASPKDNLAPALRGDADRNGRGAMEQAMMGTPFRAATVATAWTKQSDGTNVDTRPGVEALRVAQSFDPCIACAVH